MKRLDVVRTATAIACLAAALPLAAYDIHTPALTPVKEKATPEGGDMKFVENGKLNFCIVVDRTVYRGIPRRVSKSIVPAIDLLQDAFLKCFGAKAEVVYEDDVQKLARHRYHLVLGRCKTAEKLGCDMFSLPPEGFMVRTFPRGLVILGYDASRDPDWNAKPCENLDSPRGTFMGALDFCERFLDVRWYFPGDLGSLYPKCADFTVKPVWYEDAPYFQERDYWWHFSEAVSTEAKVKRLNGYMGEGAVRLRDNSFVAKWRAGGSLPKCGNHSPSLIDFAKAYSNDWKTIFYTAPSGRWYCDTKGFSTYSCYYDPTNLKAADIFVDSYRRYIMSEGKDDPGIYRARASRKYFSFGVCDCFLPLSDIVDNPTVRELGLIGEADMRRDNRYGAMANVYGRFYQYMANRLAQELPDSKLFILAYYNCKCAPTDPRWKLPPNVEVMLCEGKLPKRIWCKEHLDAALKVYKEWYDALGGRPPMKSWFYTTYCRIARPVVPELVCDVPKLFGKYMGRGAVFFDFTGSDDIYNFFYSSYACLRGQWNPEWDKEAGINEMWERLYGKKAAVHLRAFRKLLNESYATYFAPYLEECPTYPPAVVDELETLLKKAEAELVPGSVEARRWPLFRDYWPAAFEQQRQRTNFKPPVYGIHRLVADEKPVLDGVPDEAFWKKAAAMPLDQFRGLARGMKYPALVKLAWNEKGVYGMMYEDGYEPYAASKDLWENDGIEFFFAPGLGKQIWYHFCYDVNGNEYNAKRRLLPIPQDTDNLWRASGAQYKSKRLARGWSCEFFVPFSAFEDGKPPQPYEVWNFNFIRNKMGDEPEISSSAVTMGDHANLARYGIIRFLGRDD